MDYLLEQFFDSWFKLYDIFGWWSAALVAAVFGAMLPINYLYIKLFALKGVTELKERLRKFASSLTVFVLSGGLIALFTVFVSKSELSFRFVYQSAIPCGVMAMLVRALYKLARDLGVRPVLKALMESRKLDEILSRYIVDSQIKDSLKNFLKGRLDGIDFSEVDKLAEAETALVMDIEEKLRGLMDNVEYASQGIAHDYIAKKRSGVRQLK